MAKTVPSAPPVRSTLRGLQALRFVAAAMVLVGHVFDSLNRGRLAGFEPITDYSSVPWRAGVDLFFVISGFVMYMTTADRFGSVSSAKKFIIRRIIRVVPLYWFFTALAVLTILFLPGGVYNNDLSIEHVIASFFFIPWRAPSGHLVPVLAVGWTLNLEMLFYSIFALALLFSARIGLLFVVGVFAVLIILNHSSPPVLATQLSAWGGKIIVEFLFGVCVAYIYVSGVRLRFFVRVGLAFGAIFVMIIGNKLGYDSFQSRWFTLGLPSAVIVAAFVLGPDLPDRLWSRCLSIGGDASYALYLSHLFTLRGIGILWPVTLIDNSVVYMVVSMAIAIAVSIGVYLVLEKPTHEFLLRLMDSNKSKFIRVS